MIGHPLYYERKEEALTAGKAVLNAEFVETLAMVFESSEKISGGRAAELMDMVAHLLRCRKACEKHGLMREVMGLEEKMCLIYGVGISFKKEVPIEATPFVCQDIWNNTDHYSGYQKNSEDAYYKFLKFLWVKFPSGKEKQLCEIVTQNKKVKECHV